MIARHSCAFCEQPGTTRGDERIPVCPTHRAALKWKRKEPLPDDFVLDPMAEAFGRAMLAGASL